MGNQPIDLNEKMDLVNQPSRTPNIHRGWRRRLDRIWSLLKTFPPSQILDRIGKRIAARIGWRRYPDIACPPVGDLDRFSRLYALSPNHGSDSFSGQLTLLNQTWQIGDPIDWRLDGATAVSPSNTSADSASKPSHLWQFQLHYHEWLFCHPPELAANVMDHWIEANPVRNSRAHHDAWHPYCISRRIPVWIQWFTKHPETATESRQTSLAHQVEFLTHCLETDLRGNHLLENLYAVAFACCYFEGPIADQMLNRIETRLETELEFQVGSCGEHYERSPMYQCVVTANLLRLAVVASGVRDRLSKRIQTYARRMWDFLEAILCPDGEIPLLSDSCFGEAPSVALIRQTYQLLNELTGSETSAPAILFNEEPMIGDYWIHRTEHHQLMLDAGQLAAPGLPGHAHCDLFNLVGSLGQQRVLIDSGNGSYDLDATRRYCRSSAAHNVATVDGLDHADTWSKFRMGFRGQPVARVLGRQGDFDWIAAAHDAYRRQGVARMKRWVAAHRKHPIWVCQDWIAATDWDRTAKFAPDRLIGYLHFSPHVQLIVDQGRFTLVVNQQRYTLRFFGCEKIQMADGLVCHQFGEPVTNTAIVYSSIPPETSSHDWHVGWMLAPLDSDIQLTRPTESDLFLQLSLDQQVINFRKPQL